MLAILFFKTIPLCMNVSPMEWIDFHNCQIS